MNIVLVDDEFIGSKHNHKWKCNTCETIFENKWNYIQQGCNCPGCYKKNSGVSRSEVELRNFLKSIGLDIVIRDRKLIYPKELDIVIPSHNIAIEYCGLYWHSDHRGKDSSYHRDKMLGCNNIGYQLITIFEDEWINKNDIVKNRLRNIFYKSDVSIPDYKIESLSQEDKDKFLDNFHILGSDISELSFGIIHNNSITSAISIEVSGDILYIMRFFCDYRFSSVSAMKIFMKYIGDNYTDKSIGVIVDSRWSEGELYKSLGFSIINEIEPQFFYISKYHRTSEYVDGLEIKIYDCGHSEMLYRK